ncbi:IS200/IS605 family transposase [Flammeovirga aprica JL-4]|uniref:IS200/IS605 family transposase n=1 Tax=Flammeovirga aprica JL-4 TaxID=694437 RepID=A0A7X9RYE2_9BACT|nr:IS200/IS605 family transposase [Flammeovirga aprica JL-4]
MTFHIVFATKYRYHLLVGNVQHCCKSLLIQICEAEGIEILKGVLSKDHVHIEYPLNKSLSEILKRMKGRTSRLLQQEFPNLRKRYWGKHFWAGGYGAWSTVNVIDQMVNDYLEHHRSDTNDNSNFMLE